MKVISNGLMPCLIILDFRWIDVVNLVASKNFDLPGQSHGPYCCRSEKVY
jgi:hypothetical protein